ncbi:MAG: cold shock domain-containing protein [Acetobacteraceae bacterium]|jgi:cold shock CspA family protein|nr:cold shock domain-containing protein [Acetobacteraceae bacterium]
MAIPLQVTFKGMDASAAMEARIAQKAERLARLGDRIKRCHVTVEAPNHRHRQGGLFRVLIELDVPGAVLVVAHDGPKDHAHEDPYVALRDAFAAAVRRLEDHIRKRGGYVKQHEPALIPGRVARFIAGEAYGFIETQDGREVYFHRNSVANGQFDALRVGDRVRVAIVEGDQGPQASAVHLATEAAPS